MDSSKLEPSLLNAVQEAEVTKTITPLLKQELKYTILNRRHKTGKGDLILHEEKPNIKRELTADEKRKKLRRKEQNRRAAQRCREKKKVISEQVLVDYIHEQQARETLAREIESLKKEKELLQRQLDEHLIHCARAVTPTPVTPNQTPSYDDRTTFTFTTCPTPSPYASEQQCGGDLCPTPSPYASEPQQCSYYAPEPQCGPNASEPQCGRDMCNQYTDPFDTLCMYPNTTPQEMTSKDQFSYLENLGTINCEELPELDLPDEFSEGLVFHHQPCSPGLQAGGGRQSISEYPDDGDCLGY